MSDPHQNEHGIDITTYLKHCGEKIEKLLKRRFGVSNVHMVIIADVRDKEVADLYAANNRPDCKDLIEVLEDLLEAVKLTQVNPENN